MTAKELSFDELQEEMRVIAQQGIQADTQHLKKDMCAQFADPDEWIREFVVNAFDARATYCIITVSTHDNYILITVEDNGHGMDRQGCINFNTIFRSVKIGDIKKAVGRLGVGKVSVAAVPGQIALEMISSTGLECWRMKAGYLLSNDPILLEQIEPVPKQGTKFTITFEKKRPLADVLLKLKDVLNKYVRYLPMDIVMFQGNHGDGDEPAKGEWPYWIRGDWNANLGQFEKRYHANLKGNQFEIILELGQPTHEIYQNRVLVTTKYNLISHGMSKSLQIPHLKIRVDSPDFELPFGRHCLSNEDILESLADHIRNVLLPDFFNELKQLHENEYMHNAGMWLFETEEIACSLMRYDSRNSCTWCRLPVFSAQNRENRLSLVDLREEASKFKKLYLENESGPGTDYSMFDAPVLSSRQPGDGLSIIKEQFQAELINLSLEDIVLEMPQGSGKKIGNRELNFQKYLGFHPEALQAVNARELESIKKNKGNGLFNMDLDIDLDKITNICEESKQARDDLADLQWRVNYLVERDGTTPCRNHRFLYKAQNVVLNLNHPEIDQLLELSEVKPELSGHFALYMCLNDGKKILSHLTSEAREDLIQLDAITRVTNHNYRKNIDTGSKSYENTKKDPRYREFLRKILEG